MKTVEQLRQQRREHVTAYGIVGESLRSLKSYVSFARHVRSTTRKTRYLPDSKLSFLRTLDKVSPLRRQSVLVCWIDAEFDRIMREELIHSYICRDGLRRVMGEYSYPSQGQPHSLVAVSTHADSFGNKITANSIEGNIAP